MRVVNQITFEAKDDADALRLAAERLGKDAVILSTRTLRVGGIMGFFQRSVLMVSAGILEDEPKKESRPKDSRDDDLTRRESLVAFQKLMEFKERSSPSGMAQPGAAPSGVLPSDSVPIVPLPVSRSQADSARAAYASVMGGIAATPDGDSVHISSAGQLSSAGLNSAQRGGESAEELSVSEAQMLRDEVGALAQRLDTLVERLGSSGGNVGAGEAPATPSFRAGLPAAAPGALKDKREIDEREIEEREIEKRLQAAEVDAAIVERLLADYNASDRSLPFTEWLGARIPCSGDLPGGASSSRKVMFLGPTGVGKTTTIAKLAAIQALLEHRNVLLLTSDTYRIAAVDQLRTYAKILGVPIEVIFDEEGFVSVLNAHPEADLVLLDTAGRAQRDRKSLEAFEELYGAFAPDAVHLVLAANMKYRDMLDVVEHIPKVPISHLIFTKLDETVSYGAIFNVQQVLGCPVSFLTAGQNVPNDIETATGRRVAELLMTADRGRRMA